MEVTLSALFIFIMFIKFLDLVNAAHVDGINIQALGITCWTCTEMKNNEACNIWAPDIACPSNTTVCQTVHTFQTEGKSHSVTKSCVHESQCSRNHVGCQWIEELQQKVCTSCCSESYCNEEVPTSHQTAINLSTFLITVANDVGMVTSSSCLALTVLSLSLLW